MQTVIARFQRIPRWIVYLTILIIPGGLLVAPLVVAWPPKFTRRS